VVTVVSRGSDGLALDPPAGRLMAWLINDVSVCRFPCRGVARKRRVASQVLK
jgi:hypothetical protein